MALWRCSSNALIAGVANFQMKKKTIAKAMIPPISSGSGGTRRSRPPPPDSSAARYQECIPTSAAEEEQHEADQGESLGEGDAQEHGGAHHAGSFGLASHGLHRLAGEDPDTETWAERGETVAHHVDAACDPGRLLRQNLGGGRDDGEYCVHLLSSFLPLPWVSSDL